MFDVLIRNGLILDGTGNPGHYAAVGVRGGKLSILRGAAGEAEGATVIDASGLVVAPGFIDMHAHSGLMMLEDRAHHAKILQGVTTEVIGVDGNSYAPFSNAGDLQQFALHNSGLDGRPDIAYDWRAVEEYLDRYVDVATNVAYVVGNSPIRITALGWERRPAAAPELASMRTLVRDAMSQGAFGVLTGLDYPPGSYADTAELIALCEEVADVGGIYHTHMRYGLGDRFIDPIAEACDIGVATGVPVHLTHLHQRRSVPGAASTMLDFIEARRSAGLDVTFDCFPYLHGSTRLSIALPQWVQDGGPHRTLDALHDQATRTRLREEMTPGPRAQSWDEIWLTNLRADANREFDGKSIGFIAVATGRHPVDVICDLLIDEDLGVSIVTQAVNAQTLPKYVSHPLAMIGSDGLLIGDHPSPRTYGTFPTVLGAFTRDERYLTLPEAVRKLTSFPAARLGLPRRGMLLDDYAADVCIFDPGSVHSTASQAEPKQPPEGIKHVLVNGVLSVKNGERTAALAGKALKRTERSA